MNVYVYIFSLYFKLKSVILFFHSTYSLQVGPTSNKKKEKKRRELTPYRWLLVSLQPHLISLVFYIGGGGLRGISEVNIMNAPLVISVLLNSPGLQFFAVIQGGEGEGFVGHCPILK